MFKINLFSYRKCDKSEQLGDRLAKHSADMRLDPTEGRVVSASIFSHMQSITKTISLFRPIHALNAINKKLQAANPNVVLMGLKV